MWFGGGNICFATLRTMIVRAIEFNHRRVISGVLFAGSATWMGNVYDGVWTIRVRIATQT